MMKWLRILLLTAVTLGLLTACSSGDSGKTFPVTVVMGENNQMTFSPKALTIEKGSTVQMTLVNKDTAESHSFLVPELNVKSEAVPPGQTGKLTFKATRAGTFETFCDVPGHKAQGMTGTLTVTGK